MVKIKDKKLLLCSSALPTVFLLIFFIKQSPVWIITIALSLFIIIALLPFCRKRENLWMFIFVAVFGLPVNIYLSCKIAPVLFGENSGLVLFTYSALLFFVLFSVEEVLFAAVTRIIWRKQYKLFPKDFEES